MYRRHLEHTLRESLADTRVVMIAGPRQSGKTTLARQLTDNTRSYVTLDDEATYQAATDDPVSFIGQFDYATIDEVQRAPELIRRIKIAVDEDQRPGRFLLTGSANILTIPTVSESLAGRMVIETLLPLSQGEIAGRARNMLDALFETPDKGFSFGPYATADIEERVLKGGYPEMLTRQSAARRRAWADNYIQTLLTRDIREILDAYRLQDIDRLMQSCAIQSAQLAVYANVANDLQISTPTVQRYMRGLEHMYLLAFLPAWHRSELKRLVKTPKLHFLDSGLLSSVRRLTSARIAACSARFLSLSSMPNCKSTPHGRTITTISITIETRTRSKWILSLSATRTRWSASKSKRPQPSARKTSKGCNVFNPLPASRLSAAHCFTPATRRCPSVLA